MIECQVDGMFNCLKTHHGWFCNRKTDPSRPEDVIKAHTDRIELDELEDPDQERSSNQALLIDSNYFQSSMCNIVQSVAHIVQDCTSTSMNAQSLVKDPSHPRDIPATEAEPCCAANLRSLAMLYFDTLRQN